MAKRAKKKTARKTAKKTVRKTAKKAVRKTAKKAPARAAARTTKATKITGARGKARTKSETLGLIAEHVGISKKETAQVFEVMSEMIAADLKKGAVGQFTIPGLAKVVVQRKPATKARKGINPFTGEETVFKAKPARNVVKVRPMKGLKDLVA